MLKKILLVFLIVLQLFTQSAFALEFQPVVVQPIPAPILLNSFEGNPSSDISPLSLTKDRSLLGVIDLSFSNGKSPTSNLLHVGDLPFSIGQRKINNSGGFPGSNVAAVVNELTATSGGQSHSYAYDALGSRSTADSVSYTRNSLNQYTAIGSATYTNGNTRAFHFLLP
jgi:hypothetical protein